MAEKEQVAETHNNQSTEGSDSGKNGVCGGGSSNGGVCGSGSVNGVNDHGKL